LCLCTQWGERKRKRERESGWSKNFSTDTLLAFGVFVFNFAVHFGISVGDFNFGALFDFPEEVKRY
jgi:hypothetical protein